VGDGNGEDPKLWKIYDYKDRREGELKSLTISIKEGAHMNELIENLRMEFHDEETRHIYAEDLLNSYIATQIKVLREKEGWTQSELAERAGMKQERISVLEDVNYSSWTASVLKRIAKAYDLRLSIKFESFGSYMDEFENFNRKALLRPPFKEDPAFRFGFKSAKSPVSETGSMTRITPLVDRSKAMYLSAAETTRQQIKGEDGTKTKVLEFRPRNKAIITDAERTDRLYGRR